MELVLRGRDLKLVGDKDHLSMWRGVSTRNVNFEMQMQILVESWKLKRLWLGSFNIISMIILIIEIFTCRLAASPLTATAVSAPAEHLSSFHCRFPCSTQSPLPVIHGNEVI